MNALWVPLALAAGALQSVRNGFACSLSGAISPALNSWSRFFFNLPFSFLLFSALVAANGFPSVSLPVSSCCGSQAERLGFDSVDSETRFVDVDYRTLSTQALRGLIEEFITRQGTDYGVREVSLDDKVTDVERQLKNGEARIVFDTVDECANIVPRT